MTPRRIAVVAVVAAALLALGSCRLFSGHIACVLDVDCPSDALCENGRCVAADGSEGEEGEGEGGGGEGEGAAVPCSDNADCDVAAGCTDDGFCAPRCNDDGDCASDQFCRVFGFFTVDKLCVVGCRIEDGVDNCGAGDICSTGTRRCVQAQPSPRGQNGLCAAESECAFGLGCFIFDGEDRGYCSERCTFDTAGCNDCCPASGLDDCAAPSLCAERCDEADCPGAACCPFTGFTRCLGGACYP
jgi:hypothetical protein